MWLALDTATDRASIAIRPVGAQPLIDTISGARRQAALLLPALDALLQRAGTTLDHLEGIAVSDGPGSFTGLRVGASVAKALAHARGVPLWTAPSLMVRAAGVAEPGSLVLAFSNALRGEVYAAAYRFYADRIATELPASVRTVDKLVDTDFEPDFVVGEAPPEIVTPLENWSGRSVITGAEALPQAVRLFDLIGRPGGAKLIEVPRTWEPHYGRPAEAQARWEMAHGRPLPDSVGSPR